ncbi:MAG: acetolactate synthase small subunit, partial [Clostridia bacterium]
MKHIISVVVRNNSGVLARVSSLFGRRGFNIDSLSVSATDDSRISRITVVVNGDDAELEQVVKQTAKLVDTISVTALAEVDSVCRELILVKVVSFTDVFDKQIVAITDLFGGLILDISAKSMIIELTGENKKIDEFTRALVENA